LDTGSIVTAAVIAAVLVLLILAAAVGAKRKALKTRFIVESAMIAALYSLMTILIAPISSGLIQCRISEALCVLPYFTPAAVPGLFVGCVLANLLTGAVPLDIIAGSLATLAAALMARWIGRRVKSPAGRLLVPAPAVLVNALVVGWLLSDVYKVGAPYPLCALYVGLGQIVACYALGMPLLLVLERYKKKLFS